MGYKSESELYVAQFAGEFKGNCYAFKFIYAIGENLRYDNSDQGKVIRVK